MEGMSVSDDLWGEEEDAEGKHLEREWARRREEFWNAGYREGVDAGKQETVQQGFNEGYAAGAQAGEVWGVTCGAAATLAAFAGRAPALVGQATALQQLLRQIEGMPLPQVTIAVCRHLAAEAAASSADAGAGHASDAPPSPPPPGHVQHAGVQQAMQAVSDTLCSLGLKPLPALSAALAAHHKPA